jgi:bifunctional N-acetylglucosamine-1-phosphate-uridyltransferase/glucosamine-1-phosphate-acetyltransferase GlmU-like protein
MCGIIGIASNKPVSAAIINSLRKLEYRGYDSSGIATLSDGILNEAKSKGRVDILEKNIEVKKSTVGKKSKINHLSYIGDSEIGRNVNVGAGTITCNYDGVNKNKTKIKDNVFIGSNSSLVAPITLEKNSIVGAGSVITKKVKKNSLALTRNSQAEIKNYKRKIK